MAASQFRTTQAAIPSFDLDLGPLPNLVGYVLRRAQINVFKDFIDTCAEVGVRPVIYSILTIINLNPGARQGVIGAALGIKRPNTVSLINELESLGLAKRKPHQTDLRSHTIWLTPKGKNLLSHLDRLVQIHEQRMTDLLGEDDRKTLIDLLGRLQQVYGPDKDTGD